LFCRINSAAVLRREGISLRDPLIGRAEKRRYDSLLVAPAAVRVIATSAHRKERRLGLFHRSCRIHQTAANLAPRRFFRSSRPAFTDLYARHLPAASTARGSRTCCHRAGLLPSDRQARWIVPVAGRPLSATTPRSVARRISNGHACVIDRVNKRGTRSRRGEREECEAETDFPAREAEASDRYYPPRSDRSAEPLALANYTNLQIQLLAASQYQRTPSLMSRPCGSGSSLVNWILETGLPSLGSSL